MKSRSDVSNRKIKVCTSAILFVAAMMVLPAQAAMNRRQPVNWGAGSAQTSQSHEPQFHQWRPLWRYVWSRTEKIYDMRPAASVAGSRNCPANLGIGRIVEQTIDAVSRRRSGDVVNRLGRFQVSMLCLSPDGAHGVDFALSAFNLFANRDLRGRQREEAVAGTFNLGLLAFDAIQYSGRSWWLPVMSYERGTVSSMLQHYPGRQLGLWLYDMEKGSLQQVKFGGNDWHIYTGLMHAFAHPGVFDRGECSLLSMAAAGFSCGRGGADSRSMGSGTGSGGGGGLGMGGGSGGATSCMIEAATHTGTLGMLSCVARASGLGGSHIPTTAASHVQMQGVIDSQCAASDGNGKAPKLPKYDPKKAGSKHADANKSTTLGRAESILHSLSSLFGGGGGSKSAKSGSHHSKPPPEPQPGEPGYADKMAARNAYYDKERAELKKHGLKKFHKSGGHGIVTGGGSAGGGACGGHGTNAAMQVAASFACTGTGSARGSRNASGPSFPGAGGGGPFAMPAAGGGAGGAPSGLLSCAMQGGSLVRTSVHDKRCQQTDCARGASCSCNGSGGGSGSPVGAAGHRVITSPNNMNRGAMDFGRNHVGNASGFSGPKLPSFSGGPSKQ